MKQFYKIISEPQDIGIPQFPPPLHVVKKSSKPYPYSVWALSLKDGSWWHCGNRMNLKDAQSLAGFIKNNHGSNQELHVFKNTVELIVSKS